MIVDDFLYLGLYVLLCGIIIATYVKFSSKGKREWLALSGEIRPVVTPDEQRREYIRLEATFPVEFQKFVEPQDVMVGLKDENEPDVHQGFTKNISRNGMCIESVMVKGKKIEDLIPNETKLRLIMNIPADGQAVFAVAVLRWVYKTEEMAVDRYMMGVEYVDIAGPDLEKITKYALWFRKRPDMFLFTIVVISMLVAALLGTVFIYGGTKAQLIKKEERIKAAEEEHARLLRDREAVAKEKEEIKRNLDTIAYEYAMLLESVKGSEAEKEFKKEAAKEVEKKAEKGAKAPAAIETTGAEEALTKTAPAEAEEIGETQDEEAEPAEPVVELRPSAAPQPAQAPEEEIVYEPNITRKMIESEKDVCRTFRDLILKEEIQRLDRYCSGHRTSIYHPASLFALGELRYKNRHIKEMTVKAYRDVIVLYPRSKYASYASHRLDQLERNLPYTTYNLRYFHIEYNLPPLFDYRELEPYKE